MEKYNKIAVVVLLCIVSASAGFLVASLPLGSKGPTDYSQQKAYPEYPEMGIEEETAIGGGKGVLTPAVAPIPSPAGRGTPESQYTDTDTERKIIQRASLSIEVKDFQSSSDELIKIVERYFSLVCHRYRA